MPEKRAAEHQRELQRQSEIKFEKFRHENQLKREEELKKKAAEVEIQALKETRKMDLQTREEEEEMKKQTKLENENHFRDHLTRFGQSESERKKQHAQYCSFWDDQVQELNAKRRDQLEDSFLFQQAKKKKELDEDIAIESHANDLIQSQDLAGKSTFAIRNTKERMGLGQVETLKASDGSEFVIRLKETNKLKAYSANDNRERLSLNWSVH